MLELKKINKSFQIREDKYQHVLKDLSVTFPSSGFVTLLGASGNGKTTVLNIIGGLDTPDSGEIYFNKEKIEDFESFRREKVSFIFQDLNLIPHLNALDNVILGISDETQNKKERAKEILLSLGLEESLYKRPDQLSGGQQQRVAIARTIAKNVDIIICDEPTGSLDNDTKKIITDILEELSKEKLVIFITHNLDLANLYSDMIFETVDGRIVNHSHLIKQGQFDTSNHERIYDSNVLWLAFKNIIGRYKHTIRYALFIVFIMLIASTSIVIQGEYVKKYIHDISLDTGIKSIRTDYVGLKHSKEKLDLLMDKEAVESIALMYNTQVRLTTGRIYEPPKLFSTDMVQMTDKAYFEKILLAGKLPEEDSEVLMTSESVIAMLTRLGLGGQRLKDQYATGELDAGDVFDLVDLSNFTVFEKGWPKFKIAGIIDDSKIYEKNPTIYITEDFTDLFEYTSSDRPSYLELPRELELSKIIIYKENVYRESHDQLLSVLKDEGYRVDGSHEKRIGATYNKIDSFFSLSVVFLYVIIAIASISFVSLLSASIFERKYEIGLYRTKGYTKYNIMKILGLEMYFLGFISLIVSMIILLVTAFIMYLRIDYITSISHVFKIINIPLLALALFGIVTVFVVIIVYISNSIILRESVLSNIKDTGHNKKTIRKQVALVLLLLCLLGIAQVTNKEFELLAYFESEATTTRYENRDDFSNVSPTGIFETFSKEALQSDFDYLTGKIYTHTHLNTDYNAFKASHEYAKEHIFNDMTKLEYLRLIKPITSSLNSVHTDISFTDDLDQVKVFADKIYALDGKIYLEDNAFYKDIPKASEIISINKKPASEIIDSMFYRISSEGENDTFKYFVINSDFAINYLISVEYAESFKVKYISPDGTSGETLVDAVDYKATLETDDDLYAQSFTDTYGLLTVKSLMPLENDYNKSFEFIDDFFKTLKEKELDYMILDLRGSDQGQVNIASHLMSYLLSEEAMFLDTEIALSDNHFTGKLFILQDGGSSSVTGQVLSVLKDKNRAYHIGVESSNGSLISRNVQGSDLENTNLRLSMARDLSSAGVSEVTLGQGVLPDYEILASVEDMINNEDIALNLAAHIVDRDLAIDDFSSLSPEGLFETYTKKELKDDLDDFKTQIEHHPHLFTDEEKMEILLVHAEEELSDGMTKLEFMRLLQPIAASLNAHNTLVFSQDEYDHVKLLADKVYAEGDKLYLSDNAFYSDIPLGSQILSINGRQASDIIDLICSSLSSDGDNLTYKYYLLNEDFGGNYFKYVEYLDYFDIEYIRPDGLRGSLSVEGIEAKDIEDRYQTDNLENLSQDFRDDYAVLKIRAFSPLIKDDIDDFFKTLKEKDLKYLVLDLRGNAGGDTDVSDYLLSYLVPDHPLKADASYHEEVLVLQDGSVTSIAGQFLSQLRSNRVGISFGDEAGSSSVITTSVESKMLENSNLVFNYSTQVSDMGIEADLTSGIIPDYEVTPIIEDIVSKKDSQLAYVEEVLKDKIHYGEFYNMNMEGLFEVFSKEDLTSDLDVIVDTLKNRHTNLYTDMDLFESLEDSIRNELHDDMTKLEFLRLVTPLVSSANCWQTSLSYSVVDQRAKSLGGAYSQDVFDSNVQVFADKIHIYKDKLYLYDNTFYEIPLGSEILSINGKRSSEIIDALLGFIASDGHNKTLKYDVLNSNFSWYYFLYLENTDKFDLIYTSPNGSKASKSVHALGLNEIAKERKSIRHFNEPIVYNVYDDYAYLDINTFDVYEQLQQKNFRYALYDFFMEMKVKETDHLILDLRGNHGGNPVLVAKLLTYLQPVPHRYWSDHSEDHTELSSPLVSSNINYSGKIYVLMDGGTSSTTGHLIALLKYHNIATFIGQESGSTYISSDTTKVLSLTNTKINLSFSTEVFEVDAPGLDPGKGLKPDYEIIPSVQDLIDNSDPVLDFARRLMK
ncbi:ATP-binding cassette domain-containing protein [Acidaminobacter sp. JC074]|uniref:S41 family peptidase n=1 Tax=Acidaminobacter sp. JC074 TaxID=2530199 RepID=UPI001F11906D|nr:S41 family peptidase [Acidaminobacter sp. JC074]MCH4890876.1 ATP-binding cassette domain-containing protein [Acidaminobacter sp. JC074]